MMPAAKHFDPVVGVDIHIIQPPLPAPPVPIPHPFVGFIVDPFDYVPIIGATVYINGVPRTIAGTMGKCVPHIPIGGMFFKPPVANECEMFMGSATVAFDGDAASYMSLPALSCHCIGMIAPIRPKKKGKVKSMVLPTCVVLPIPAGPPVFIGGPPTISLMAIGMKLGMMGLVKGLGRGLKRLRKVMKKLRKVMKKSKRMKALSGKLRRITRGKPGSKRSKVICFLTGHPVDVVTGRVITDHVDFELPGPIPFKFERNYYSDSDYKGPLGHGWHHSYDQHIFFREGSVFLRGEDGREIEFGPCEEGGSVFEGTERLTLEREGNAFVVRNQDNIICRFGLEQQSDGTYPLTRIEDLNGNAIVLEYGGDRLVSITDSAGRLLRLINDRYGRLVSLQAPHPDGKPELIAVARFEYDEIGHLIAAYDTLGHASRYQYKYRMLIRETDRNGLSFYFEYDKYGKDGRCVHTWGDGGIYDHKLTYDRDAHLTVVENSYGAKTSYYWNDFGLVVREIDALGGETTLEWDDCCCKTSETDPNGNTTRWEYDEHGNLTTITDPMGHLFEMKYDTAGNCVSLIDVAGNTWTREVDGRGNLLAVTDPTGGRWDYQVDKRGLLVQATDPLGKQINVEWDAQANLQRVVDRIGSETRLQHDALGRIVRRFDACGGETKFAWDQVDRLTELRDAVHRLYQFDYDAEGNLLKAVDPLGQRLCYAYGPRGMLRRVEEEDGAVTRYCADKEGRLVAVHDANGRQWTTERDAVGSIVAEQTFDGRRLIHEYDAAGRLRASVNARGQRTEFLQDATGRLRRRSYHDGTMETFDYDARGLVVRAENASAVVTWEYDAVGQVVGESVNGEAVQSQYDALGNRVSRTSAYGRVVQMSYDAEQRLKDVGVSADPMISIINDPLGREVRRTLPGGVVCESRVGATGELLSSRAQQRGKTLVGKDYRYDRAGRLEEMHDLTFGVTRFQHDPAGRLAAVTHPEGTTERYLYDAAGNVPGIPDVTRISQQGEYVSQVNGWQLRYDRDGNLTAKSNHKTRFLFDYDGAGRLSRVTRNGDEAVEFTHDPLGRIIRKTTDKARVDFLWDGDVPLGERIHEIRAPGETTFEYLFMTDSFEPLAVLGEKEDYFLHCDQIGAPWSATDRHGDVVWHGRYKGFGGVGQEHERIPFRFPGQLADRESGLHYNRARYYDPEIRMYITPNPIGLAGGVKMYNYVPSPVGWIDPYGQPPEVVQCQSRTEAMRLAQQHAQVPRASKGGLPIGLDKLGKKSRGKNFAELKANGATHLGRRDPSTLAKVFDHPDGHPHQIGAGSPPHHKHPHVHARDKKGVKKVFEYPGAKCP